MITPCYQRDRHEPAGSTQAGERIDRETRLLLQRGLAKAYRVSFPGNGREYQDTRTYQPGDDLKTMDGKASARTGRPLVKTAGEEGNRTLFLLVDISASTDFGSTGGTKRDMMAELASMLALSALNNNDRVGLVLFSDIIEHYLPPARGRAHSLRLIRELCSYRAQHRLSTLTIPLDFISRMHKRRAVVLLLSDFVFNGDFDHQLDRLSLALRRCKQRHELSSIMVSDPREHQLPDCGLLRIEDMETGRQILLDSAQPDVRQAWRNRAAERWHKLQRTFVATGIDTYDLRTDQAGHQALFSFFRARSRRPTRR